MPDNPKIRRMIQDLTRSSCVLILEKHGTFGADREPVEWLRDRIEAVYTEGKIKAWPITVEWLHMQGRREIP
jgi:hypothetical protein